MIALRNIKRKVTLKVIHMLGTSIEKNMFVFFIEILKKESEILIYFKV